MSNEITLFNMVTRIAALAIALPLAVVAIVIAICGLGVFAVASWLVAHTAVGEES